MHVTRKSCPFCAAKPLLKQKQTAQGVMYRMECHGKECRVKPMTQLAPDKQTALRWWNRRAECAGV